MKAKQLRCNLMSAILSAAIITVPVTQVRASGFPVVDVANLGQALQDFITQNSQLAEQIAQYQQMLTDYQLMIDNLQGYADVDALKAQLIDTVNTEFNETLNELISLDPNSGSFEEQVGIIYEDSWGAAPPDESTVNTDYSNVFDNEDMAVIQATYDKDRQRHDRYVETFEAVARNRERAEDRKVSINRYSDRTGGLGPNDQMKALQITALQMNLMLQQMEASIASQDQMLARMEEEQREALEARLDERKRELDRVKRQTTAVHIDYDMDTWLF